MRGGREARPERRYSKTLYARPSYISNSLPPVAFHAHFTHTLSTHLSLSFAETFPTVTSVNLGGGYKVGRNPDEVSTDLQEIGMPVKQAFEDFATKNGRQIKLEIEPGTFLVANAGCVVSKIQDVVTTSEYTFLKLDCGMTDLLRPSLYGAIHPVTILPGTGNEEDLGTETEEAVIVGHCCESGDLMTPLPGEPESLGTRVVRKAAIGDYCVIDGSGAYCSGMSTKNYNSFPEAGEVLVEDPAKRPDEVLD